MRYSVDNSFFLGCSIADRAKIHTAVTKLRVDPSDIPVTARPLVRAPSGSGSGSHPSGAPRIAAAPFGSQRATKSGTGTGVSPLLAPLAGSTTAKKRKAPASLKTKAAAVAIPSQPSSQPSRFTQPPPLPPPPPPSSSSSLLTPLAAPVITMTQQKRDDEAYGDEEFFGEEEAQYTDFYVAYPTSVVGIQYYDGLGELLFCSGWVGVLRCVCG